MPRVKTFQPNLERVHHRALPSWRVRRATELFNECIGSDGRLIRNQVSKWIEGAAVYRYVHYLKAKRVGYVQERRQAAFLQKYIDIELANEIERQASPTRLELRSRLLLGESSQRISERMGIDEKVVLAYWCYFFDIYEMKDIYLLQDIWPTEIVEESISPSISQVRRADKLEFYCVKMVNRYGSFMIDKLVDFFIHFGEKHDLSTPEGRSRESWELRFDQYYRSMQSDAATIRRSMLVSEKIRQSSSYANSNYNIAVNRFIMDDLFENAVPTPVTPVDFDFVEPRKSPRTAKAYANVMDSDISAEEPFESGDFPVDYGHNTKTSWEPISREREVP